MKKYKALIIGLGSIGRRHVRVLKSTGKCAISILRLKNKLTEKEPGVDNFLFSWKDFRKADMDFAIICTPPFMHVDAISRLAGNNIPFIVEKPVCISMKNANSVIKAVKAGRIAAMVGFNMRYHYLYRKIREIIRSGRLGRVISFLAETGQYLPDWRDYEYEKCYSASKKLGGGVIFDLTHEIDIAVDILGPVDRLSCLKSKLTDLKIDTEDNAEITFLHKNKAVSHLHLDYIQKKYTRKFKFILEKGEIFWDYSAGSICVTEKNRSRRYRQPAAYTRDDMFRSQLRHWFNVLEKKGRPLVPIEDGIYVSKLAIACHKSSDMKRWIKIS